MKNSSWFVALRTVTLGCAALLVVSSAASAQRGGGGGRSGGRGGGGMGGGMAPSPMQRVKEELKLTDYFEFLDDKGKQIGLDKAQKDSVKSLNKQLEAEQKPVLKEVEKFFQDAERAAMQGGGGAGGGGARGGGRGEAGGEEGGRGRGGMAEGVRALMLQLVGMQEDYATKAKALFNEQQKPIADSLNVIYQADLRDRQRKRARG